MEGNYRRAIEGRTDDPYLKSFGEGVIELAGPRRGGRVRLGLSAAVLLRLLAAAT